MQDKHFRMNDFTNVIETRRNFSKSKIDEIRQKVDEIEEAQKQTDYCIYATGSYARYEASENSDLDLFFLHTQDSPVSNLSKTPC